jgi:hypothetical protein
MSSCVEIVVDEATKGQIFSYCFGFPCQFHKLLHIYYSSYNRHYVVSILRASLNNKLKLKRRDNLGDLDIDGRIIL